MNQPIYEQPQVMEPPAPAPAEPRYRLPSYGSVDVGGPALRIAEMDPELRLKKLKAEAQAKNAEKKRQTDRIVSPIIQEDLTQATAHERELQAELEKTRQALEMPYQRPGMDQYDMIAAGVAGLFGGAQGFNQATQGAYQRSDQQYDQNYQVQRQNAQADFELAQNDLEQSRRRIDSLKSAYINAVAREDDFERDLVLQQLKQEADKEAALLDHANRLELEGRKAEGKVSLEQAKREGKLDPAAVNFWKSLMGTVAPEARAEMLTVAMRNMGMANPPNELLEAVEQMNVKEQLDAAKRQTEDATRPGKVANLNASAQQKLSQVFLNDARRGQIEQRVAYYPQEFQLKVANTYSLIDQRSKGKVGTGENYYYGKGDETAIRSGLNAAKKTIAAMNLRTAGGPLSAEDAAALKAAQEDAALFARELEKVQKAKTARVRTKYGGQGMDVSGGFTPFVPPVVDAAKSRFGGAKASGGGDKKPKPQAKAKATTGRTRSGATYTFDQD